MFTKITSISESNETHTQKRGGDRPRTAADGGQCEPPRLTFGALKKPNSLLLGFWWLRVAMGFEVLGATTISFQFQAAIEPLLFLCVGLIFLCHQIQICKNAQRMPCCLSVFIFFFLNKSAEICEWWCAVVSLYFFSCSSTASSSLCHCTAVNRQRPSFSYLCRLFLGRLELVG